MDHHYKNIWPASFPEFYQLASPVFNAIKFFYTQVGHDSSSSSITPWTYALQGLIELPVCWAFLFKTEWLIKKLHLENALPEESIQLNMHRSVVLKIVVILMGLNLMANGLPTLLRQLLAFYQNSSTFTLIKQNPASPWIIQSFLMVVIGYSMVAYSRLVVNFIERQQKK